MKKTVITYGTFDLLHQGHINLLKRAKALGDYLIVGVTSEAYDISRGKLNVRKSCLERIEDVKATGLVDKIIIEEYEGQKILDIQKYNVDIFTLGSDWIGKFDYLNEFCEVRYLERTKGISSTELREASQNIISIGVIGSGRIANRFIPESKFVSGVDVVGVYNPNIISAKCFSEQHELKFYTDNLNELFDNVSAVYIASPHLSHYEYIKKALLNNKHVLCEKPIVLKTTELEELHNIAKNKGLILMEAIKTAYCQGFNHLMSLAKSGAIGELINIEATFTKLCFGDIRELNAENAGGSMTELASYVLLPIVKLFGTNYKKVCFVSKIENSVDVFTKGQLLYDKSIASFKVGLGVKSEGNLVISGTKGYIYVPAPWWKTQNFEIRYEDTNLTKKYYHQFDGDGLRYEIKDFIQLISDKNNNNYKLTMDNSIAIVNIIDSYISGKNIDYID